MRKSHEVVFSISFKKMQSATLMDELAVSRSLVEAVEAVRESLNGTICYGNRQNRRQGQEPKKLDAKDIPDLYPLGISMTTDDLSSEDIDALEEFIRDKISEYIDDVSILLILRTFPIAN